MKGDGFGNGILQYYDSCASAEIAAASNICLTRFRHAGCPSSRWGLPSGGVSMGYCACLVRICSCRLAKQCSILSVGDVLSHLFPTWTCCLCITVAASVISGAHHACEQHQLRTSRISAIPNCGSAVCKASSVSLCGPLATDEQVITCP